MSVSSRLNAGLATPFRQPGGTGRERMVPPLSPGVNRNLSASLKTLAMTLRYSHLSPGHQLDAVQRPNARDEHASKAAVTAGAEVSNQPTESSGGARSRTADLGIMRPVRGDEEPEK
jgi:hypothetical protein